MVIKLDYDDDYYYYYIPFLSLPINLQYCLFNPHSMAKFGSSFNLCLNLI